MNAFSPYSLLAPEMRNQALALSLLSAGGNMLQAAGPSLRPQGIGSAIGAGLSSFGQNLNQNLNAGLSQSVVARQLQKEERDRLARERLAAYLKGAQQGMVPGAGEAAADGAMGPSLLGQDPRKNQQLVGLLADIDPGKALEFATKKPDLIPMTEFGLYDPLRKTTISPTTTKQTDLERQLTATGLRPGTPEYQKAMQRMLEAKEPLEKVIVNGEVKYVPRSQAAGQTAPEDAQIVFDRDNKPIYVRGGPAAIAQMQTQLTQATQNKIQDALVTATGTRQQLTDIASRFKPEYQQIGTRAGLAWDAFKDKANLGKLGPDDKANLDEFTQYRASSAQLFANILKEMSGVAVNPTEFKRAEAWVPNPGSGIFDGDSPTELAAKVKRFSDFNDKAIARLHYATKNGLSVDDIKKGAAGVPSLDEMPKIMEARGRALETQFSSRGLQGDSLRSAVREQLAREFGLVSR